MRLGGRDFYRGRCCTIAEVGQAHDGSLGLAHAFIDAIAAAGADAVKFQTHIAAAESTPAEPWRIPFAYQDASRYDYWKRMEFSIDQWAGLKRHAEDRGLLFLSSPFSLEAVDLLERVGVCAWKVASGETANTAMVDRMAATGLPVLLSTGMSDWSEIDSTVARLKQRRGALAVLQCTTLYPCPPDKIGIDLIPALRERYACAVGLSDHSGTIFPGLVAASLGIEFLEVHVTLSREMFGPDVPASVTTAELTQLVAGVRFVERMYAAASDKNAMSAQLAPVRALFSKSVVARRDLPAGTVLAEEHVTFKKPGTGIPPAQLPELIGRRLLREIGSDELLQASDLEP